MLRTRPRPGFKYDACSKPAALGLDVRQWHILVVSCIVIWIGKPKLRYAAKF